MISRRHMHLVIALLLPLMVLRAMLPAGYMPVTENGTFRIAMCSDGLYPAAAEPGSATASDGGNQELPADSGECAFAGASPFAPPPFISATVVTIDSDAGAPLAREAPTRSISLVRVQSARGPPTISL